MTTLKNIFSVAALAFGLVNGEVAISQPLKSCLEVAFPGRKGNAVVRDMGSVQPISPGECPMTVDSDAPVELALTSGTFKIEANASYAVNFSDRPPRYLRSDAGGRLLIPISKETNFTALTVCPVDGADLLKGVSWNTSGDSGKATRDSSVKLGTEPSFKLEKTDRDGKLAWESEAVSVATGKEYLVSALYRITNSAFGSKPRFQAILRGAGKPERLVREYNLTFYAVPLFGAKWCYSQVRVPIPEGYGELAVSLSLEGSAQTIWWDDLHVRQAPKAISLPNRPRSAWDTEASASLDEVRALWKNRPARGIKVAPNGLVPELLVDGKATPLLFYNMYSQAPANVEPKAMLRAGIRTHFTQIISWPREWWKGKGDYDFSEVQKNIEAILQFDPEALIFLNVQLAPRYRAWGDENPDAVWRDPDGKKLAGYKSTLHKPETLPPDSKAVWYASYSAEDYRRSVSEALRALAAHLKSFDTGKSVGGVMFWGGNDNQWQRPWEPQYEGIDHSPGAELDFRRFLKTKYGGTPSELQKAWESPGASFENAVFPKHELRNPSKWFLDPKIGADQWIIDANAYGDEGVAQSVDTFGRVIKEAMGRDFLALAYFHDLSEFGGRSSTRVLLEGKGIDGIVGIPSYSTFRNAGAPGQVIGALKSYALHGKLHLCEFDVRTHVSLIGKDAFTGLFYSYGGAPDENSFLQFARRDAAATLTRGAGAWFLVMPSHMFATPGYREHVSEIGRAYSNAAFSPDNADHGQCAVYFDAMAEHATRYSYSRALSSMAVSGPLRTAFSRSGVTYDTYLLSDVTEAKRPQYKAHFFLTSPSIDAAQIRFIRENLQKDGNVLVFCGGAGISSRAGSFEENLFQLTGIKGRFDGSVQGIYRTAPISTEDKIGQGLADNCEISWDQPLFYADDAEALSFGKILPGGKTGWALKRHKNWTGVYIAIAGNITPELIRNILLEAGEKPLGPLGDVTFSGNGILAIHALSDGNKKISFPRKKNLVDLSTLQSVGPAAEEWVFPMSSGETRWFRTGKAE